MWRLHDHWSVYKADILAIIKVAEWLVHNVRTKFRINICTDTQADIKSLDSELQDNNRSARNTFTTPNFLKTCVLISCTHFSPTITHASYALIKPLLIQKDMEWEQNVKRLKWWRWKRIKRCCNETLEKCLKQHQLPKADHDGWMKVCMQLLLATVAPRRSEWNSPSGDGETERVEGNNTKKPT